jgi:DNA invertase Pin-like site-specific DNA recombinase
MLDYVRPGDTLVITKLDRLGRSVAHLVELVAVLAARGVDLRVLHQGIDTSTPAGKLTFHVLAAIAEFYVMSTRGAAVVTAVGAAA